MTAPRAANDMFARRHADAPKSPMRVHRAYGHPPHFIRDSRRVPACAGLALGCEVRKVGRDMLIGLLSPVPAIAAGLGGVTTVTPVPIPLNCTDGFNDAYSRVLHGASSNLQRSPVSRPAWPGISRTVLGMRGMATCVAESTSRVHSCLWCRSLKSNCGAVARCAPAHRVPLTTYAARGNLGVALYRPLRFSFLTSAASTRPCSNSPRRSAAAT